jgi:ribonuclease HII
MPSFALERAQTGLVAGLDEAGRGPLAGPVIAAAVVLERRRVPRSVLALLDDSKALLPEAREEAYAALMRCRGVHHAVGGASVLEIDRWNILQATFLAMRRALRRLPVPPVLALIDGNQNPRLPVPVQMVIGGDASSYSIAAASIVAKVTRDRLMQALALRYPGYEWHNNKGYGTAAHLGGIEKLGATPHHRRSFAPFDRLL